MQSVTAASTDREGEREREREGKVVWAGKGGTLTAFLLVPYRFLPNSAVSINSPATIAASMASRVVK